MHNPTGYGRKGIHLFSILVMKKLVIRFILFCLVLFAVSYSLDLTISHLTSKVRIITSEDELWRDIYDKNINAQCYIYGTSRAKVHLSPQIIQDSAGISVYNFGNSGQTFKVIYLQHKKIIEHEGYPKQIVLSIDPAILSQPNDIFNRRQLVPYMLWDTDFDKYLSSYDVFSTMDCYIPLLRYHTRLYFVIEGIKEWLKDKPTPRDRDRGYTNTDTGAYPWIPQLRTIDESLSDYPVPLVDQEQRQTLIDFVEECKKNNVALAFVYTPINSLALDIMRRKDINYDGFIHQIAKEHNIPLLDYTKDSICYDQDYFTDSFHLNRAGSELITMKMINDFNKIDFFK